jgi:hypothetical protein
MHGYMCHVDPLPGNDSKKTTVQQPLLGNGSETDPNATTALRQRNGVSYVVRAEMF